MTKFEGHFDVPPGRFALVASRFNQDIVDRLVEGARQGFTENGLKEADVDVVWVPGAFEIPLIAQQLAGANKYLAIVGLGCVIQGMTDHYEYVCRAVTDGILRVTLDTGIPVIFGILTCQTHVQALERAGGESNKGHDAALAALEMASLIRVIHS